MIEHAAHLEFHEILSPWRRAERPAGTAFGIGFLLAGLAGAGGIPCHVETSPQALTAILAALTGGLLSASAMYILFVLYCSIRCGNPHAQVEAKTSGHTAKQTAKQPRGEALIASLLFMALLAIVVIHECVK